ncbi:MAG: filamentous hemagglutinin N-terminal domain-containing protein [Stenomitos rutilans HA7619-LM2]|jgi:filamentous hemagglutinin family protein|nr:filamentous hemagglutinin N-terminal domain-containing protein [Stenomitos rutilans HA7619-LM2]
MTEWNLRTWVLLSSVMWVFGGVQPIAAQVVPDATLPAGERSQVTGNPNVQIDGGARRGGNLFHSFSQFSVPTGGSAYFNNAADVQNIFSRVTGGSVSNIDGLIRANGAANLFLLNPNGILFGPNASLNIGGSFAATTANAIGFPNGEVFSSDATQPLPSQLLTVNPNAFFFNQLTPKPIVNQSTFNGTGLQVPVKQNLLLVGGAVQFDNGRIASPGSYVESGNVGGVGTVGLSTTSEDWQLSIPDSVVRADVSLSNDSRINVLGGEGGSIAVTARNVSLSEESRFRVGIDADLGFVGAQTGGIQIDATETVNLFNAGSIRIEVLPRGTGNVGDMTITTGSLFLTGVSRLVAATSGQGSVGSINIHARNTVSFDSNSYILNAVQNAAIGNTGGINITTGLLSLTGGTELVFSVRGQGNVGSVNIHARDTVSLDNSKVFNTVEPTGIGNAGNISITTGALAFTDDAALISRTEGQGNSGNVSINARDRISLDNSAIFNTVEPTSIGNAGDIAITTGLLTLTGGSYLLANTSGQGNAGSVTINARDRVSLDSSTIFNTVEPTGIGNAGAINITTESLSLVKGSQMIAGTSGQGNAGDVTINARDRVSVDGESLDGTIASTIFTQVNPGAFGQGGNVAIATGTLFLTNGGAINTANTGGTGDAGRVTIQARDSVQIRGTAPSYTYLRSGVFTSATPGSVGNGGDVSLATGSLSVSDQGRIITNAEGQGDAGNIQIQASGVVLFDGGDAISTFDSEAAGRGGDIEIEARSLSVLNNAQLSASTTGNGNAGNITASADTVTVNSGGQLLTTTSSNGRAGDITVKTPNLQLSGANSGLFAGTTSAGDAGNLTIQPRGNGQSVQVNLQDGAQISASTASSGRGGQLTIAAPESITLAGNGSIIAAGAGGIGAGGNLSLRTGSLNIQDQAEVTVSSSGTGTAGSLFVDANRIFLNNQGSIRADTTGGGGNINLRSPFILLRNGSNITTNATGNNVPGGNIAIDTRFLVAVLSEDSNISANSEDFQGGNVRINAFSIFGIQPSLVATPFSDITATGATSALSGTIDVITAGIDPTSGLVALPTDLADASGLIAQGCPADNGNSFVITGRGGLPPTPEQQLDDDAEWSDQRRLVVAGIGGQGDAEMRRRGDVQNSKLPYTPSLIPHTLHPTPYAPIVEATGIQITSNGKIFLVAIAPNPSVQNWFNQPGTCSGKVVNHLK